jgi:hypothetical protein
MWPLILVVIVFFNSRRINLFPAISLPSGEQFRQKLINHNHSVPKKKRYGDLPINHSVNSIYS